MYCRLTQFLLAILVGLTPATAWASGQATAPADPGGSFTLARLVLCTGLENREPVGAAESFPASTGMIFCFLEARDIATDTSLTVIWKRGGKEINRTALALKAGARWRTFARKTITNMPGEWEVEVLDAGGDSIRTTPFQVE